VAGAPLTGMGEIHLKPPYHYQARIDVRGTEAAELPQLPEAARSTVVVEGRATVAARLQGTLDPWKLDTSGTASIAGLKIDVLKLQDISLTWEGDGDRIMVKDLRAQLEGGKVTGKAVVPLRPTVAGSGDLTLKDVDVGELLKRQNLPLPVEGKADGVVKGTIPAAEPGQERPVSVAVDLKASRLLVQGIEADGLQGKLNYADGELAYDLEAKTLGGRLQVEGKVPREVHEGQEVKGGTLKLQGARLEWLSGLFKVRADEFPLSGLADATLTFRHKGPDRALVGTGHFQVTDVTWEAMDWLPNLQGDLELTRERLLVSEATGTLAQGIVRGRMGLALKPGIPSWFVLNLDRAEASRLLAPWPAFRDAVHGSVDVELRGRFGSEWTATGVVVMNRGKVAGIEANSWRLPLAIAHVAATGRGRLELRDGGGELAQGHSTLRATYRWGGEHRLEGALRFTNMNLRGVLHEATERTYLGGGRMTGRVDFAAPGLASLNDLNAVLDATLAQPQPSGLPVLKQLSPVLRISTSSSFQSGKVRARLSHGVVRFERLVLEGGPGDLSITGTVTTRGRLDLDVRANLPSLVLNTNALGMVGVRLPVQAAVPGRMLNRAPPLANRNMRLQVTGTLRDPTVRILPLSLLGA